MMANLINKVVQSSKSFQSWYVYNDTFVYEGHLSIKNITIY